MISAHVLCLMIREFDQFFGDVDKWICSVVIVMLEMFMLIVYVDCLC